MITVEKCIPEEYAPREGTPTPLIGRSLVIENAKRFAEKVGCVASPVLILGPSGSGKEVLARVIHERGRANAPFVAVNAANLSEQLMESDLFGHERGSFTGAFASKKGKLEIAAEGTVFLDEIGELTPSLQVKLLRVLQDGEYYRIGGTKPLKLSARIVAATNRNLAKMVKEGVFREDLFYRLHVLTFELTALSTRVEDISDLTQHFWRELKNQFGKELELAPSAIEAIERREFPGNARELKHLLERAFVLGPESGEVTAEWLPRDLTEAIQPRSTCKHDRRGCLKERGLKENLEQFESRLVHSAMEQAGHNQVRAARILRISTGALQYKLKKYGYVAPARQYCLPKA